MRCVPAVAGLLGLWAAIGCSESGGGEPPVFLPIPDAECRVNEVCEIRIFASDPDGDDLEYDFEMDPQPRTDTQGVGGRPQLRSGPDGALFYWIPGIADAGEGSLDYAVTFIVSDGGAEDEFRMRLRVFADEPAGRADITFTEPPGAGMAVDLTRSPCVDNVPVSVKADGIPDADMVLEFAAPVPDRASLTGSGKSKLFNWCPSEDQLDVAISHTVTFVARRDGDSNQVAKRFTIRFKRPNDTGCPGGPPSIEHTPPGTLEGPLNYEIRARIQDDIGFKSPPNLLFSDAPGALPDDGSAPDTSSWQLVDFAKDGDGDDWVAAIPNRRLEPGEERSVHYVVIATDNDDPDGTRCDHTTESQPFTFVARGGEGDGPTYGFCAPCVDDEQCGGEDDLCVDLGGETFCTVACEETQCPAGQECVQMNSVGGRMEYQCVPADLNCGQICVADRFDAAAPNEDPEHASAIEPNSRMDLTICGQDADFFAVPVEAMQSITVTVRFDNDRGDIDLAMQLPGDDGAAYQSLLGDADEEVVHEPCTAEAGTAIVAVFPYQDVRNEYSIEVSVASGDCDRVCDDDALDDAPRGNDHLDEFTPVESLPFAREGLQVCPLDPDFYAFDGGAGEFVRVSIAFEHSRGDLQLRLRRSTGDVVGESLSFRDAELIEGLLPVDDLYVVEVFGATRSVATAYDLFIDKMLVQVCQGTRDCPAAQFCLDGACREAWCSERDECGAGHQCVPPRAGLAPGAVGGECVDDCFADGDCRVDNGYTCKRFEDYTTGCAAAGAASPGERCSDYADCVGDQVCFNLPGGYCATGGCDVDLPCGDGTVCVDLGGFTACLKRCAGNGDCRVGEGYGCVDLEGGESVCLPCDAGECP